ncbi:MAG TPA: hypothetical protein VMC42_02340 [Methanoregulaceae archaeon]|nr:hypothetical protein [Methanoregulaceae archaeon]
MKYKEKFSTFSIIRKYNLNNIINILLIISIIFGLALKLLISQNISLDSDMVYSGIASHVIWAEKNFFMINFYAPQVDPYYFTDIYPFQLIPQIVTNFNPAALKFVAFLMFCFIILVFGYIIFKISKNLTNSLIFSALVANLLPLSYYYYAEIFHVGTVLLAGIILLLLIDFPDLKPVISATAIIVLVLTVYSDSLTLIWLVVPGLIYYIAVYVIPAMRNPKQENVVKKICSIKGIWFVFLSLICTVFAVYVEKNLIPYLTLSNAPLQMVDVNTAVNQVELFIKNLLLLYNSAIYQVLQFNSNQGILGYLIFFASLALLILSIVSLRKQIHKKMVIFCLCSIGSGLIIISLTNLPQATRYLIFYGILIFVLISLCYRDNGKKVFLVLIFIVILLNGISGSLYIYTMTPPNQDQQQLIAFLEDNNLTNGFGDYWDSNVITYLSNDVVTVRAVVVAGNRLYPFRWLSSESWYSDKEASKADFLLVKNVSAEERPYINHDNIQPLLTVKIPTRVLHFKSYDIYVFN